MCCAFGLFIILNWKHISNPELHFRNAISEAIFAYERDDLAIMRYWGFYYPWSVVGFLIYLQSVLITYLLIKKNLYLSSIKLMAIISSLIFLMFLPTLLEFLSDVFESRILKNLEIDISDFISTGIMICTILLFFCSIIMFFVKRCRKFRKLFALSIFTVIMNVIFIYSFFELFFD